MKLLSILICLAAWFALNPVSAGQQACGPVAVRADVEVPGGELSLADLLAAGACPKLVQAASRVHLGRAPLVGSVRVLEGNTVLGLFRQLQTDGVGRALALESIDVPRRVSVRRSGRRASCADIELQIRDPRFSGPPGAPALDCGGAGRIRQDAPLEFGRAFWDPASESWEVTARCVQAADCVPFLVRAAGRDSHVESAGRPDVGASTGLRAEESEPHSDRAAHCANTGTPLVRPGQTVTLVWDESGIRLVARAVCLDRALQGQSVRARILRGGRVVRAVAVSAGTLRAGS